ncbi:O-antigen ligase family protein, partial [Alphaproteobacteria bacterium]|nr:O-antigen ligase family protein [Alphaproteobacteria bacterium]
LIYLLINKNNKIVIIFSMFTILITIPSILLSGEKISIFNFFLSIILLYSLNLINFSKKINLMLLFILFCIFYILVNSNIFSKLNKDFNRSLGFEISSKNSFNSQLKEKIISVNDGYLIIWRTALKTQSNQKNLLFGNGPKTYEIICLKNLSTNSNEFNKLKCANHPHNLLLQFTFSFGLLGTLFIYCFAIYLTYKLFYSSNYNNIFISLIPMLLIIFSPHNTYNFFNNWTASQVWFFLSIFIFLAIKKDIK